MMILGTISRMRFNRLLMLWKSDRQLAGGNLI
jgi:hypothetical protein